MRFITGLAVSAFIFGAVVFAQNTQGMLYNDPFKSLLPEPKPEVYPGIGQVEQTKVEPPSITISGILWGTDMPEAIIDGEVYKVGDTLKNVDARLYKIENNKLFVFYEGMLHEMQINKPELSSGNTDIK